MKTKSSQNLFQIGQIARKAGTTVRTVRYYMEEGFIEPAARSAGGFYLFSPETAETVFLIRKLSDAGFSLNDIKDLYRARAQGRTGREASGQVLGLLEKQKDAVEQKIRDYMKIKDELEKAIEMVGECRECGLAPTRENCRACSVVICRNQIPMPVQAIL